MKSVKKTGKKLFHSFTQGVKTTATNTGLVDRKDIVIKSHKRKCVHRAFWLQQVTFLRDIQASLKENYDASKVLLFGCCCCRKEDLKTMIAEAVDEFQSLPTVVMESGHEVSITAELDLSTIRLDSFQSAVPQRHYYDACSVGELEQGKAKLKADIVDLKREHTRRHSSLQRLANQHRRMELQNSGPSSKELKDAIKCAFRYDSQIAPVCETTPLVSVCS